MTKATISTIRNVGLDLLRTRGRGLKHAFARRSASPVIVFDSDDWGSQRVPSPTALASLVENGILTGQGDYDRDTLETAADLSSLMEVLAQAKGSDGRPAVFSCYCNPANPDFAAIRANGFERYEWKGLSATLQERGDAAEVLGSWREGRTAGLLSPQYHGREHLQVNMWMAALRSSPRAQQAFNQGLYSVPLSDVPLPARGFRAANFFTNASELGELAANIRSGAQQFYEEFGIWPKIYCPTNNIFHPALYPAVRDAGCVAIIRHVRNVEPNGRGGVRSVWGTRGVAEAGLQSFGRNTVFEPTQRLGVDHALAGIASAFAWGVPAVVSTHRANYVGGIDPAIRDQGLRALRILLKEICQRWPAARFVPSTALLSGDPA